MWLFKTAKYYTPGVLGVGWFITIYERTIAFTLSSTLALQLLSTIYHCRTTLTGVSRLK